MISQPDGMIEGRIQFKGADLLTDEEMDSLHELSAKYAGRLHQRINNEFLLELRMREYQRGGTKHRYEVQAKFSYPGAAVTSDSSEWDVVAAVRESLEAIDAQLVDRYHAKPRDGQGQFTYSITGIRGLDDRSGTEREAV